MLKGLLTLLWVFWVVVATHAQTPRGFYLFRQSRINTLMAEADTAMKRLDWPLAAENLSTVYYDLGYRDPNMAYNFGLVLMRLKQGAKAKQVLAFVARKGNGRQASLALQQLGFLFQDNLAISNEFFRLALIKDPRNELARYNYEQSMLVLGRNKKTDQRILKSKEANWRAARAASDAVADILGEKKQKVPMPPKAAPEQASKQVDKAKDNEKKLTLERARQMLKSMQIEEQQALAQRKLGKAVTLPDSVKPW